MMYLHNLNIPLSLSLFHACLRTPQGLGNAFLSNVNACDALFHVVSKL